MGRKAKNCKEAPSTRPSSAPRVYSAEQMVRALVSLGNEALLLPDSLHVPLYARGTGKVPPGVVSPTPQPPIMVQQQLSSASAPFSRGRVEQSA